LKVLIIQTAFLGDAVLSTSLAEALHHHFPRCRLDVLVRKGNESLFEQHPFIHKIFVWDKKQNKILNLFKLISQIRREHYDEVINIQRFFSSGLLTVFSGAKTTSGFVKNPLSFFFSYRYPHLIGNGVHETKRNLSLISHLVKTEGVKPCLYPSQKDFDAVQRLVDSPYVCMAPASVWFTKQLPVPKWVELIQQVKEKFNVVLIGGKDDVRMGEEIIQHTGRGRVMNMAVN
jgi:ADP-heptose:LPS heptosyltransferase